MAKYTWVKEAVPKKILVKQVYGIVFSSEGNVILRVENDKYKLTGGRPEIDDNDFSDTLKRIKYRIRGSSLFRLFISRRRAKKICTS